MVQSHLSKLTIVQEIFRAPKSQENIFIIDLLVLLSENIFFSKKMSIAHSLYNAYVIQNYVFLAGISTSENRIMMLSLKNLQILKTNLR